MPPLPGTASPAGRCRGVHNDITHDSGEGLSPTLERNIQALVARRRREQQAASGQDKVADAITAFTGSMIFVYLHLALFGFWIIANLHWIPGIPAWDESFVVLAMIASVEAIFLSTFVLISQNRMTAAADKRADLDLQISLLAEHELTKLAHLLTQIAERLEVKPDAERDLEEAARDIAPERVLDKIEETRS
ncbi:putative membrane protein [Bradyrhizobium yuanmingense]